MRSDKNITTRNKVKEHAPKFSRFAGTALGNSVLPGVGGLTGGIAAKELHQKNKESIDGFIDKVGDMIEDTFCTMEYEFCCPNCSHTWVHDEMECRINKCMEENGYEVSKGRYTYKERDYEYENANIFERELMAYDESEDEDDEEKGYIRPEEYRFRKIFYAIRHYCLCMVFDEQPEDELDYERLVENINNDTDEYVTIDQIKADTRQEVCDKLFDILSEDIDLNFEWRDVIMQLSNGDIDDEYKMEVYDSVCIEGRVEAWGNTLIGVNTSGYIEVGDSIIICTTDGKKVTTSVVWIEKDDAKVDHAESGEIIGLGVDIDLSTIPGIIDCVYKADEMEEEEDYKEENDEEMDEEMDEDNDKYSKKEIEKRILNIISEHLNEDIYDINRSTQLVEDLEVDSLDTVELIMTIEKEFNLIISDKVIKEIHTVGDIIDGIYYVKNTQDLTKFMFDSGDSVNESDEEETGLTPEEQEYIDEYKEIVSEGEISARNQRYLAMLRETNGISGERAEELEAMVNNLG